MPLHDVGYRAWKGTRRPPGSAAFVIATTGIALSWKSRWLRRAVLFAWSPALAFAMSFFAFEQAVEEGRLSMLEVTAQSGRNLDGVGVLGGLLVNALGRPTDGEPAYLPGSVEEIEQTRRTVWSRLLLAFMRAPQAVLLAVVIGLVAPTLISRDMRAKAWLVYFTRPVSRRDYILGKGAVLAGVVAMVTLLPALGLWFVGVLVSPSVNVAWATADLPLKVLISSLAVAIPTVLLALAYSAITTETRIAGFAWFATWVACWITHSALGAAELMADRPSPEAQSFFSEPFDGPGEDDRHDRSRPMHWLGRAAGLDSSIDHWAWVSPYHSIGVVQAAIFGMEKRPQAFLPPLISLASISAVSLVLLLRRVDAPLRS
ncbi:MAG: ABC transporter permease subunit [Pirellulales bacterium]|nr:ABC transporter permease subunit [Pirellulales bacterium]